VDLITAVPTQLLLDSAATRFAPGKLAAGSKGINFVITDRDETVGVEASDTVMIARLGEPLVNPAATVSGPRQLFLAMLFLKQPVAAMQSVGLKVEGDAAAVQALIDALDPMPPGFPIVTP
jgi:alkyl sulfatase BDS1-like metallo-beta-lactamase superfamily hydrolase